MAVKNHLIKLHHFLVQAKSIRNKVSFKNITYLLIDEVRPCPVLTFLLSVYLLFSAFLIPPLLCYIYAESYSMCIYTHIDINVVISSRHIVIKVPFNKRSTCWIIINLVEDIILNSNISIVQLQSSSGFLIK